MSIFNNYQTYKNEYIDWRNAKEYSAARRQEYLRRNPDAIEDYDLQRAKTLLNAVDLMDKSVIKKTGKINTMYESAASFALGYAGIGGATLGFLLTKFKFVKNFINKIMEKHPKSKNIIPMAITVVSGVLGILGAYPIYTFLSTIESKIHRKRRFDNMEKELQDPKIFVVLDEEQKKTLEKNLSEIEKNKKDKEPIKIIKNNFNDIIQLSKEALYYDKEQNAFRQKYEEDKSLYNNELNEKEIKDAKKDRVLLSVLIKDINTNAQSYSEKMQRITDNLITISFALGSLFTLGYERIVKSLKLKSYSLPASMGVAMLAGSTFFATWAQKRAEHVGRFKAKQDLQQNPERLVYISRQEMEEIEEKDISVKPYKNTRTNMFKFLKEFFRHNKEYEGWKKTTKISGKEISEAMKNIEISNEQLKDGKRLQNNLFKALYKVDNNTQRYSSEIDIMAESVKYPTTLILGTLGSVWGMKHLAKLRSAIIPKEVFKHSAKYIGTILAFTMPSLFINSYFAKAQKMGARISDMTTMKELEDYRFFADYSRFEKSNT